MATLVQHALDYFSSINPVAKKILQEQDAIRKSHGDTWSKLSREEQDDLFDEHFIGQDIKNKYHSPEDCEEVPSSFPKLLVNCGEKIVVDFDKECWTWRDEHSSPFSWETRSQQDLNIWEEDDEGLGSEPSEEAKDSKPKRPPRRSRSPERDVTLAFKPERSIWESPFLAADRGLDAGYHSSQASDQSTKSSYEAEEADDVLKNFGLAVSLSGSHAGMDEESKLLDSSFEVESIRANVSDLTVHSSHPSVSSDSPDCSSKNEHKQRFSPRKSEAQQSLIGDVSFTFSGGLEENQGHISPVYLEDPGESSTDITSEVASSRFSFATEDGASVGTEEGQVNMALEEETGAALRTSALVEDWKPLSFTEEDESTTSSVMTTSLTKTGFDFLDNW